MQQEYDQLFKICIIGDSGVGKSCIVQRFADDTYSERFAPTVGVDFRTKNIVDEDKIIKLHIWDTAGQERFKALAANSFRGTHGVIYAYDITDRDSFLNVKRVWIQEVAEKMPKYEEGVVKLLVGNKSDLSGSRVVPFSEAKEFAEQSGFPFLETSAKDDVQIAEAFHLMARAIREMSSRGQSSVLPATPDAGSISLRASNNKNIELRRKLPCCS